MQDIQVGNPELKGVYELGRALPPTFYHLQVLPPPPLGLCPYPLGAAPGLESSLPRPSLPASLAPGSPLEGRQTLGGALGCRAGWKGGMVRGSWEA